MASGISHVQNYGYVFKSTVSNSMILAFFVVCNPQLYKQFQAALYPGFVTIKKNGTLVNTTRKYKCAIGRKWVPLSASYARTYNHQVCVLTKSATPDEHMCQHYNERREKTDVK